MKVLMRGGLVPLIALTALAAGVSAAYLQPLYRTVASRTQVSAATLGTPGATAPGGQSQSVTQSGGGGSAAPAAAAPSGIACARGQNGGATDTGVSGTEIKLASTTAESGVAGSFLGPVRDAMEAVKNLVNRSGGICGRLLSLDLRDDGWVADTGQQYIQNFIDQGYFALAVVPSSEGLDLAVRNGVIDHAQDPNFPGQSGIPVVGTDGMLVSQYRDPWVWPVATSTASTMHIIAKYAYDHGARHPGLVYETTYKFGPEGATAFRGAVSRLPGMSMGEVMPIQAGQADYSQEVNDFNGACKQGSGCDFVAYLLEPQTALQWVQDGGMSLPMPHGYPTGLQGGGAGYAGPQPLFTNSFAVQCGSTCNGFTVWTGFSPDSAPFAGQPPVQQYAADVQSYRGDADLNNQFLEGGYVGMKLLVQALQQTGPYLTRARLKQTLDSSTLDLGLSSPLSFKQGYHYADVWSQGFAINYTQGFTGFQYLQTGWVQDPWVGMDESSG